MITEKSCGAVVFTKDNENIKYLIIESKDGVYGFPKGHVEKNETEIETAKREIFEETGLHVEFRGNFRTEDTYQFQHNGETIIKNVVYFLAEFSNQSPEVQVTELNNILLANYETALSLLRFESAKRILKGANKYLLG